MSNECDDGGCGICEYCVEFYEGKQEALRKWADEQEITYLELYKRADAMAKAGGFWAKQHATPLYRWMEEHGIGLYVLPGIAKCIAEGREFTNKDDR